ncbi:MAG: hypothetical protein OXI37_04895 [Gammaproteobacteria bacterium]|nr:hypothetical protein [Gammaproteobacteria bacterium]
MISAKQNDLINDSVRKSKCISDWTAEQLNNLRIPSLPHDQRLQISTSCLHLAIEHSQAIIVLVDSELYGSALALQRPLFEALTRGIWLRYYATNKEVADAIQDKFPKIDKLIQNSLPPYNQKDSSPLQALKEKWWRVLCSYTHPGSQQLYARLSSTGLCSNYECDEVMTALLWSDMAHLFSGMELALASSNELLAKTFLNHMNSYIGPS